MMDKLHVDLQEAIISHLDRRFEMSLHTFVSTKETKVVLSALSCSCQAWRHTAQKALFRYLYIGIRRNIHDIAEFLSHNEVLSLYVRNLEWTPYVDNLGELQVFYRVLRTLPGLQRLRFRPRGKLADTV